MKYLCTLLIYTLKCTSSCKICCLSCSPNKQDKMKFEDAKRYIKEANEAGIKIIGIAGGEPFLYMDEIFKLFEYASELNMGSTFTTNCFWADTYEKTFEIMSRLQKIGVKHFKISADEFHNEIVPYENIKNVLVVAKKLNFSVIVGCTALKTSKRLKGLLNNIEDYSLGINLTECQCYPLGNAKTNFADNDFLYVDINDISGKCREGSVLTIMPDGKTYPCGSMCGMTSNRLVGSALEDSVVTLIEKAENNKQNKFIKENGIISYYDYIKKNDIDISIPKKAIDTCHACYNLFDDDNNITKLDKVIDEITCK